MHHSDFVPLHLHTQYSLLDGAIRIKPLLEKAHEYKMAAIAITDHGNLFGAIEFYRETIKSGIKPIIGCEVYVAPNTRFEKKTHGITEASYHLVLLARDINGYKNLMKLVSAAYLEGFYYRPRIDKELLEQYSGGLLGLSACLKGEVPLLISQGNIDAARESALKYKRILGAGNFYLEIQDNGIPEQKNVNSKLIELGQELHIPIVATADSHYLRREDAKAHDILLCIQTGKTVNDRGRMKFSTDEFYFKSPEEMKIAFREIPEVILNTREIAERCNLDLKLGEINLPYFDVPDGYTKEGYLEELARKGLDECLKDIRPGDQAIYRKRLENELKIIRSMGFAGYFLIVWDFIQYAKRNKIPVGPGRGSAAGSLVAFTLGITEIDPIPYGLLFERFLNPERISMPDIDVDFCMDRRDKVIDYVTEKYGSDHVTQIITFGTMAARGVIRDVGRVLDIPYAEVDKVAKLVHNIPHITLEEAIQSEPRLKEIVETNTKIQELFGIARSLEGLPRHASTHAAGVVISQNPLTDHLPLYRGQGDEITTQYDMGAIEKIGLVKFDFLGLKTLTVIDMAEGLIRSRPDGQDDFSIKNISLEDRKTYELLSSGNTFGIFQVEGYGMRELLIKMRPKTFEDLIALVALYRPGPLQSGMVDDFIKRRKGIIPIKYEMPQLENILKETYGVILYQEQVVEIANLLAGFSLGEADILRRAMGKKRPDKMEKQKKLFIQGAKSNGISEKKAEKVFDLMAHFAGYGFNKSHSAAYAMIVYRTAYLKAHYPLEFMASLLTCEMDDTDKIARYIGECKDIGIGVLPPHINKSYKEFTVEVGSIRFGLSAIKNVGTAALDSILTSREKEGEFSSLFDLCKRVDFRKVNRKVLEVLIKAGTFDFLGAKRSQLMHVLETAIEWAEGFKREKIQGQVSIFNAVRDSEGHHHYDLPEIPEWSEHQILSFEKETLGLYITGHPLASYEAELSRHTIPSSRIYDLQDRQEVTVGGTVNRMRRLTTKRGETMATLTVEDLHGSVEVLVFPDLFKKCSENLSKDLPLIITGEIDKAENGIKIKAKNIRTLSSISAGGNSRRVEVRLNSNNIKEEDLNHLKKILLNYPGSCPVFIRFRVNQKESLIAVGNLKVDPSESFISEIEKTLDGKVLITQNG